MMLKRIARTILPIRAQKYLKTIIGTRRADQILSQKRAACEEIRLELGAGPVKGRNGMITLDLCVESDVCWDLLMPLPFPKDSVSLVYSSHLMEHFYYADLIKLLKNCFTVIKPGGAYSACVPDASIYLRSYCGHAPLDASYLAHLPAVISDTRIDVVNYIAYMGAEHRYMFDEENLVRVVKEAGFSDVRIRQFDPSLDLPERRHGSIYVTGKKP